MTDEARDIDPHLLVMIWRLRRTCGFSEAGPPGRRVRLFGNPVKLLLALRKAAELGRVVN